VVFDNQVDAVLKEICLEIAKRYELVFLEVGTDKDHVHFLIQSVPTYSPTKIVKIVKSRCSSAITLTMNRLEFGGQKFSNRPDMIRQSSGHARGSVAPRGLHQSRGV
jgi:REP element-mobilizing transposase RayT